MPQDDALPVQVVLGRHAATWTTILPEVDGESGGVLERLPAFAVGLFTLSNVERAIDAAALLRERVIEDPPYWALVWTGARAIAALASTLPLASDARILDLGCGLGLAGLAAASRGAAVTFGDYLEEPLEFVRASLDRQRITRCEVRRIDFTAGGDDGSRYDVILAADIVYDPAHYAPLAAFLDLHLAAGGTILLTESLRADAAIFLEGMLERGFVDDRRALWVAEDGRRERTWLHVLERRDLS